MLEAADADAAGGTEGAAASAGDGDQGPADSSEPSDSEGDASEEGEMGEDFDVEAMARQILEQAALAGDEGAQREVRRLAGAGAATAAPAQPKERAEPRASGLTRQKKRRKRSRITVVET